MKAANIVWLLAAPVSNARLIARQEGCNQDNCLRAINGTNRGPLWPSTGSSDCSSYWTTTSVVSAAVVTANITVTSTITAEPTNFRRLARQLPTTTTQTNTTASARTTPTYASACLDLEHYSSACSCIGVTPTTLWQYSGAVSTVFVTVTDFLTTTATTNLTSSTTTNTFNTSTSTAFTNTTTSSTSIPTPTCSALGQTLCRTDTNQTYCADLTSDPNNCGECSAFCPGNQVCRQSTCVSPYIPPSTCSAPGTCGSSGIRNGCGPQGSLCVCGSTDTNQGICVSGNTICSSLTGCNATSDCGTNEVCAVNSCCGRNVCIGTTNECVGGVNPNGTFGGGRRGVLARGEGMSGEVTFGGLFLE